MSNNTIKEVTRASLALLLVLAMFSPTQAQENLPPEVRADLLQLQIVEAIKNQNYELALERFDEYDSLEVEMPAPLMLARIKLLHRTARYTATKELMEVYLDRVERGTDQYNAAIKMYASIGEKIKKEQAQRNVEINTDSSRYLPGFWEGREGVIYNYNDDGTYVYISIIGTERRGRWEIVKNRLKRSTTLRKYHWWEELTPQSQETEAPTEGMEILFDGTDSFILKPSSGSTSSYRRVDKELYAELNRKLRADIQELIKAELRLVGSWRAAEKLRAGGFIKTECIRDAKSFTLNPDFTYIARTLDGKTLSGGWRLSKSHQYIAGINTVKPYTFECLNETHSFGVYLSQDGSSMDIDYANVSYKKERTLGTSGVIHRR